MFWKILVSVRKNPRDCAWPSWPRSFGNNNSYKLKGSVVKSSIPSSVLSGKEEEDLLSEASEQGGWNFGLITS